MNFYETFFISPLANGLILFYKLLGNNIGLAIVVFSFLLKHLLNPLSSKQLNSAQKMKELAPKLEKLKKKYKSNPQKLAQAQADFYKEHGVNPLGGCLPQIFQLVILIAFFGVFTRTLYPGVDSVEGFNKLLYSPLRFAEGETLNSQFLYLDVTEPDVFRLSGLSFPIPGPLLFLAALAQFLSVKIMQPYVKVEKKIAKKTKETTDDMQVVMQQSMTYMFPVLTLFIGVKFPAGLALYWLVFSLYQVFQQYKMSGWGGLTPLVKRIGLLQSRK